MEIEFAICLLCCAICLQLIGIVAIVFLWLWIQDEPETVSEATESDSSYDDSSARNSMAAMNTSIQMMQWNTTMNGFM
jgi:uncharacterized protein YpmS